MDVIVVGSGLAGLACAEKLQAEGIDCQVLEADQRLGGRIKTDSVDGFLLDHGFQVLLTAYPAAKACFDYSSLKLNSFLPGAVIRYQGTFQTFVDPWRQPTKILQTARSSVGSIADKLRVARLRSQVCRGDLAQLDQQQESSTFDRLRAFGFSPRIIEAFFRPFLSGIFLEQQLTTTSRKFDFVFRMFSQGVAALPAAGMKALPQQIAQRLKPNSIRTQCAVEKIQANQVFLADGQCLSATAIVVACDQNAAQRLLDPQLPPARTNGTLCLYFAADRSPITEGYLYLNGEGSGPINNLCVPSLIQPSYAPPGRSLISVSVVGKKYLAMESKALEELVRQQLGEWFGTQVHSWQHLRSYFIPEALPAQNFSSTAEPKVPGDVPPEGIFVCGDYLENASINGAIESGWKAAQQTQQWLATQGYEQAS